MKVASGERPVPGRRHGVFSKPAVVIRVSVRIHTGVIAVRVGRKERNRKRNIVAPPARGNIPGSSLFRNTLARSA